MADLDYVMGQNYGLSVAREARREANAAVAGANAAVSQARKVIGDWKSHADGLTSKLAQAELSRLQVEAQLAGRDAQQKMLREALRQVAPNHPLLQEGALATIGNDAMTSHFLKGGYAYDREKATLRKI
ncbi:MULTISPECIES: hypothetical protein [Burkholderia cepacia complex]|uniref:hypothetical protein n=1 Tax=Burkholderia cepacia complex TaxID=87882 RepID=UPI000BA61732|nr:MULTISPECIES: hypothetical protein [Burkholderia cepacia complex]PAK14873.1 hypothetical protein CJO66_10590 [Burkholderia ubonensis]RQP31050.1 hypothetical protein DF155_21435 [Burkholderia ubonensis]RQP33942.1 hypothetical protein DF154_25145 [Burkholderia ubonensis]RQP36768.1 hypothetical protein DF156_22345 [Burkholderia ubonensis]RQP51339.1 hypothetical protein DF144_20945 [Burkholderia ubonensis]